MSCHRWVPAPTPPQNERPPLLTEMVDASSESPSAVPARPAELLDGGTETGGVVEGLAHGSPRRQVAAALRRLIRLGLLADGATAAADATAAAWDARGLDPDEAGRPLPVSLVDAGAPDVAA